LLTQYKGGIGGKIGWTSKAEATYLGLARRDGVTLIVTILHCTPLQEIYSAEKLLNWGFAMNSRVQPVGTLVSPLQPAKPKPTASPSGAASVAGANNASSALSGAGQPSQSGQMALGTALAALACVIVVGFVLRRRRVSPVTAAALAPDPAKDATEAAPAEAAPPEVALAEAVPQDDSEVASS
jgi:D-alanyl-D-alanine carboxypeptidase (penicillin-binding protein 5/6)